jgi:endonuclease YncB( thermonuclease family)
MHFRGELFVRSAAQGCVVIGACIAAVGLTPRTISAAPAPREIAAPCPAGGTRDVFLARVLAADRIQLADGSEVRLAGILAPAESHAGLVPLLQSRRLGLGFTGPERDRYGRYVAQLFADGRWIQHALVAHGYAVVQPEVAAASCAPALLAAEDAARSARAGGWGNGGFSIVAAERLVFDAGRRAGSFQLVEGRVTEAAVIRGRAYLNFGADWRSDFTVTIAPEDMRRFRAARFDPRTLAGARIRVRGWLELFNGPNIQIATPAAIEVLEPAPAAP